MSEEPLEELTVEPEMPMPFNPAYVALGFAAFVALQPEMAMAKGGEYGLAEGRIISLAHPTVMALMCGPPTRVSARARPRAYQHAHARISTPTRVSAHPRAYQHAHAHATHVCCAHRAPRHALSKTREGMCQLWCSDQGSGHRARNLRPGSRPPRARS